MNTINQLKRTLGTLYTSVGLKQISNASDDIPLTQIPLSLIYPAINKLGITSTEMDTAYYTTTWDNWEKILETVWGIVKNFKWTAEKFDCDNRAAFVTVLCGLLFGANTCASVYCKREHIGEAGYDGMHWCNLIIDKDGNTYLFDVDNWGMRQKITSNNVVMGTEKYIMSNARIF